MPKTDEHDANEQQIQIQDFYFTKKQPEIKMALSRGGGPHHPGDPDDETVFHTYY